MLLILNLANFQLMKIITPSLYITDQPGRGGDEGNLDVLVAEDDAEAEADPSHHRQGVHQGQLQDVVSYNPWFLSILLWIQSVVHWLHSSN